MTPLRATVAAVVLAGGNGSRVGRGHNKVYLPVAGRRIISWALGAIASVPEIGRIILAVRPGDRGLAEEILDRELPDVGVTIVDGGASRHASEHNALQHLESAVLAGEIDLIMIHDGARPLIAPSLIYGVIDAARKVGGAVPCLPATDLVEVDSNNHIRNRLDDSTLVRVQTPQAFRADYLLAAYKAASTEGFNGSDTSACVERFTDAVIRYVPGDDRNIKVTYPQDLFMVEEILATAGYSFK